MLQALRIVEKPILHHKSKNAKVQFVLEYTHFPYTLFKLRVLSAVLVTTLILSRSDYCDYRFSELARPCWPNVY
jgi:hypothetical protein